jgi:hypothetical protein
MLNASSARDCRIPKRRRTRDGFNRWILNGSYDFPLAPVFYIRIYL